MTKRTCVSCKAPLDAMAVRCACGAELPEANDRRSTVESPTCGACGAVMELMAQQCAACGAVGYPALRSRRGKKCRGAGEELTATS